MILIYTKWGLQVIQLIRQFSYFTEIGMPVYGYLHFRDWTILKPYTIVILIINYLVIVYQERNIYYNSQFMSWRSEG